MRIETETADYIAANVTLLRNMAKIIRQESAITPDQHRDLQNMLYLLEQDAHPIDE